MYPAVAPYVVPGDTDRLHFAPACDDNFRFTFFAMGERFHGLEDCIDKRIPREGMAQIVQFHAQLIHVWGQKRHGLPRKE
jgi:hypothetical protein